MMVAIVPEVSDIIFEDIPNTLEALQDQVGGYIETVKLSTEIIAIVNEEGHLMGLPKNRHMTGIVGPMVLVHNEPGDPEFHGLTDSDTIKLRQVFGGIKNAAPSAPPLETANSQSIANLDKPQEKNSTLDSACQMLSRLSPGKLKRAKNFIEYLYIYSKEE